MYGLSKIPNVDFCDLSGKGWNATKGLVANQWVYDFVWDKVTVTNTTDPINNFKLERLMDNNGVPLSSGNYIKVYEIVNVVVVL
jgi:hypothetical protein